MNYCAEIAYNGTDFSGWQRQINAPSIQQEIEQSLSLVLQDTIKIIGCGRTDTGVHARSYFFNFNCDFLVPKNLIFKLNNMLPKSIVFYALWEVNQDFNARFDAIDRTYQYHINSIKNPFLYDLSFYAPQKLDIAAMNEACTYLLGKQDFSSFSKVKTEVNNFYCEISHAAWELNENETVFTITANRFLRNMVRAIVVTMMEVGINKYIPKDIKTIIAAKNRNAAGKSVAAHALFLTSIKYDTTQWKKLT